MLMSFDFTAAYIQNLQQLVLFMLRVQQFTNEFKPALCICQDTFRVYILQHTIIFLHIFVSGGK
jgi:hypothetical protein